MDSVKLVLEYLRECEVFYMATVDGLEPRVRPMSGVCEVEGRLCFLFSRSSALYHEIMGNRHVDFSPGLAEGRRGEGDKGHHAEGLPG